MKALKILTVLIASLFIFAFKAKDEITPKEVKAEMHSSFRRVVDGELTYMMVAADGCNAPSKPSIKAKDLMIDPDSKYLKYWKEGYYKIVIQEIGERDMKIAAIGLKGPVKAFSILMELKCNNKKIKDNLSDGFCDDVSCNSVGTAETNDTPPKLKGAKEIKVF